jgi:hypothetical protein
MPLLWQRLAIVTSLLIYLSSSAEARKRIETYVDSHGVRRVQKTGKIYRDYAAVREFKRTHPKPEDGRAWDVDHIVPLAQGGADKPSNMQWVPTEEHRRKNGRPRKTS